MSNASEASVAANERGTGSVVAGSLRSRGRLTVGVLLLLVCAPVLVYLNSLRVPFVLDDVPVVKENPSIRSLWPLTAPLSPPEGGLPVCGRPLANLSFALNYAISGEQPWSYHALNLLLHLAAGLVLFAVLRRTFSRDVMPERLRAAASGLALGIAALWALHPLQTAAVTYVSQRTELLASLFYLLTIYAFIRAMEPRIQGVARASGPWSVRWVTTGEETPARQHGPDARATSGPSWTENRRSATVGLCWPALAVLGCLAGMASKEVMASAPLVVLLYDRTFIAGSFREAWRRHGGLHAALMATWILLGWLVWTSASRGGTAGFGTGVTPFAYAITQTEAIVRYLGLVVWPHPLVFDYGRYLTHGAIRLLVFAAPVVVIVGLTLLALWRRPILGFAGATFFLILAPSSSFVPVATQTIAEHRMYLPLAVVLALLATAVFAVLGRRAIPVFAIAAVAAGGATVVRNQDYAGVERLWRDTVEKRPENVRAHNNLGSALLEQGQTAAGLAELEVALRLDPHEPDVLRNLAEAQLRADRVDEALARAQEAQRTDPNSAAGWNLLGVAWLRAGQPAGAVTALREAIRLRPEYATAQLNLGDALSAAGDHAAAIEAYAVARRLRPDSADVAFALGNALFRSDREEEAAAVFAQLLAREPNFPGARAAYGNALLQAGHAKPALAQLDLALQQEAPTAALLCSRAVALFELGRSDEAMRAVGEALRLDPGYAPARELAKAVEIAAPPEEPSPDPER